MSEGETTLSPTASVFRSYATAAGKLMDKEIQVHEEAQLLVQKRREAAFVAKERSRGADPGVSVENRPLAGSKPV